MAPWKTAAEVLTIYLKPQALTLVFLCERKEYIFLILINVVKCSPKGCKIVHLLRTLAPFCGEPCQWWELKFALIFMI